MTLSMPAPLRAAAAAFAIAAMPASAIAESSEERRKRGEAVIRSLNKGEPQPALERMRPGNRLNDVGGAVEDYVVSKGYSVVREFCGHGIGRRMHEPPQVPNYRTRGADGNLILREGLVLAIEPMVNLGRGEVQTLVDGWTVVTIDGRPSAHFEHTIAVTEDGPEILTLVPDEPRLTTASL